MFECRGAQYVDRGRRRAPTPVRAHRDGAKKKSFKFSTRLTAVSTRVENLNDLFIRRVEKLFDLYGVNAPALLAGKYAAVH